MNRQRLLVVTTEARFQQRADGSIWHDTGGRGYEFWTRYLDEFDEVVVAARVFPATTPVSAAVVGPGVQVHPLPSYTGPRGLAQSWMKLRSRVHAVSVAADIALIARMPSPIGAIAVGARRRRRLPYALEVVGDPQDVLQRGAVTLPLQALTRGIAVQQLRRSCEHAAACAYVTQSALQRRYPPGPDSYTAAFPGIDLVPEAFAAGPREKFSDDTTRLVTVGALSNYKGHEVLLRAVAALAENGDRVTARLVGSGPLLEPLEALAEDLGIGALVEFVGQLPSGDAVRAELDAADIFVLPSLTEGLPRALLEAMARGLPCVASRVGGVPELLAADDTVPARDPDALRVALAAALHDPSRLVAMARRNFLRAEEYRRDVIVARRRDFLRHVAGNVS